MAFKVDSKSTTVFASMQENDEIVVIDLLTQLGNIKPGDPDCIGLSADGRYIYVALRWARNLVVMDKQSDSYCVRSTPESHPMEFVPLNTCLEMKPRNSMQRIDTLNPATFLGAIAISLLTPLLALGACTKPVYLTLDTGHMEIAPFMVDVLRRQQVKVTFFVANERTKTGEGSLGNQWGTWWKVVAADGHEFASHTYDHVYWRADLPGVKPGFRMKATAGAFEGREFTYDTAKYCEQIEHAARRIEDLTGKKALPLFRAPGGKTSPRLLAAAQTCGYSHVGWAPAGLLGDELPSEKFSNEVLLKKALRDVRSGDILMAHLGVWTRNDPWASANLEPLIVGLKDRGFCFETLRSHPAYQPWIAAHGG